MPAESAIPQALAEQTERLYRVAFRIVGQTHLAEDVVQEVAVKALQNQQQFQGRSQVTTWLHRIAVNSAIDLMRRQRRQSNDAVSDEFELAGMMSSLEPSPETTAEQRELYRVAQSLVTELPDECRRSFVLTQLDGYSYDEAAAIEEEPRGTIASRVHRARQMLLSQMMVKTNPPGERA